MPSQYTFSEYSVEWPIEFDREAARLRSLLADGLIAIHHIGSTSVPDMPAKPIIDLLPVVGDIRTVDDCENRLVEAGYRAWGEYGIAGRRFFTKDREEFRTHNIHVFSEGNAAIERHLAFCAYLRHHSEASQEYAVLKREVYARCPADISAYNDGKDDWIRRTERIAIDWFREEGASVPCAEETR